MRQLRLLNLKGSLMGKTILLLWPDDMMWYAADVLSFDLSKNKYLVRYHSDGSSEWLALPANKKGKVWKLKYDIKQVKFTLGGQSLGTKQYSLPIRWVKQAADLSAPMIKKEKPSRPTSKNKSPVHKSKKLKKQTTAKTKSDLNSSDSDIETLIKQALFSLLSWQHLMS